MHGTYTNRIHNEQAKDDNMKDYIGSKKTHTLILLIV